MGQLEFLLGEKGMSFLSNFFDGVFGRGAKAITVPALDGAFRPNTGLDKADLCQTRAGADNLAMMGETLVYSAGRDVHRVDNDALLHRFNATVAFITEMPSGRAVVGLIDRSLHLLQGSKTTQPMILPQSINCPTAAIALDDDTLVVANGSAQNSAADWQRDLLEKRRSGTLWRITLSTGDAVQIASGLAWPAGLLCAGDDLIVAESWLSRLVRIPLAGGAAAEVLGNLPGYPARFVAGADGYWLTLFSPRSQLLEFVLHEDAYRAQMLADIEPDFWIAPCLRSGKTFLEPLQAGGVKQLGVLKPWAPMRSFGMIVGLDEAFVPVRSFQSRADGARHGVTSCIEQNGALIFSAKGDGCIAQVKLEAEQ
ncbi:MAG: hypothetical protein ACJA06_000427 [Halocynthiibacter sp.]